MNALEGLKRIVFLEIRQDTSHLTENERLALYFCTKASDIMSRIYRKQVYPNTNHLTADLMFKGNDESEAMLTYLDVMGGPWDLFDHKEPFLPDVGPKPKIGSFYPSDLTEDEWRKHLADHPEDQTAFESPYTVIIRENDTHGKLQALPYSFAYSADLSVASRWLKMAADELDDGPLKRFLSLRAQAFLTNDYFESDLAWIDTDGIPFEVTIGPYEDYEDEFLGIKAMFESFIAMPDKESTRDLQKFSVSVPIFDKILAREYGYKPKGTAIPLEVVADVHRGGEAAYGRQFVAYNLPNDRRIHELKGSKKVFSRTMMEAKFNHLTRPIAERILSPEDLPYCTFRGRLIFVQCHEIAHGLGPSLVVVDGKENTFEVFLKDLHSSIEEAKADMLGARLLTFLYSEGLVSSDEMRGAVITEIADFVKGWRTSFTEAHSRGSLVEYNWLKSAGAVSYDEVSGFFDIDVQTCFRAMIALSHEFLRLQTEGDYDQAKAFMEKWGYVSPEIPAIVDRFRDLPLEVHPIFEV